MYSKSYADRVSGAVFLIGLGLLFTSVGNIVGGFFLKYVDIDRSRKADGGGA